MIDLPERNRNLDLFHQTNPTLTDCWRTESMMCEVKMIQSGLENLLQQFVLLQTEKDLENNTLPYFSCSHLVQQINIEATNLIVAWGLLKETTAHLFSENDIENNFARDIKVIKKNMDDLLQKTEMVTTW